MLIYTLHNEEVYECEAIPLEDGWYRPTQYTCLTHIGAKMPRNDIPPKDIYTPKRAFELYATMIMARINILEKDIIRLKDLAKTGIRLSNQYTRTDIWDD